MDLDEFLNELIMGSVSPSYGTSSPRIKIKLLTYKNNHKRRKYKDSTKQEYNSFVNGAVDGLATESPEMTKVEERPLPLSYHCLRRDALR